MKKILITISFIFGLFCSSYSQHQLKWHNFVPLRGRSIAVDPYRDDVLWIVGTGGLMRYDILTDSWKSYTTAEGLSKIWCRSIFVDEDLIWVGTESGGANLFDLTTEQFTPFMQFPENPRYPEYRPTVNAVYPEADVVWVGTDGGLFQVERSSLDTLKRFTMADGLGENYIYSIADDGQCLWLATAFGGIFIPEFPPPTGGLSRLEKATHDVQNFRIAEGPYVNWFWSLVNTGDALWIAGDRGLVTFDKRTKLFSVIAEDTIGACHAVVADQEDIWCIGYSTDSREHLFQVDKHRGMLKNSIALPYDWMNANLSVDATDVYVVKGNHFYRTPKSSLQLEEISTPFLPSPYCYAVSGDNQTVYAGTKNHLVVINQNNLSVETMNVLSGDIRGITLDEDNLWVSTDQGLFQYDRQTLRLIKSYLSSLIVFFTVIDDSYVWVSAHLGLYKINKQTGQMTRKDLTSDLNTFGTPRISSLVLDGDIIWLSFSGQEIGGGLISGLVKLDRNTLTTTEIKKISIGDYTQAIETLIDRGTYLLGSGKEISKISKASLRLQTFIDQKASKMLLKESLLWAIVPHGGIKVFDIETRQEQLHLSESNGLLHNWVTDFFLSDKYAWFATYAGISALELGGVMNLSNEETGKSMPESFALLQNYPNPFNALTDIRYQIPNTRYKISEARGKRPIHTTLKIYNILGHGVRMLVNEPQEAGHYTATWDGRDESGQEVASGIYFYRLSVPSEA